jgi:hypothetical protein
MLTFVLLALGREDANAPRNEDARMIDSIRAVSEDDKMLLNYLEHVSRMKVYFLIDHLFVILTFILAQTLALSKARIAGKALAAPEWSHIAELEKDSAELWAELDQARAKILEVKGC